MTANTTAEGHEIIAEHAAGKSLIFITRQANFAKGGECYVVNISHVRGHYITWSADATEAAARKSANRAWARFAGRETMISA